MSTTENKIAHRIGILGAGTWGIALARMLCHTGKFVTVWSALEDEINHLKETDTHPKLPDMMLPKTIHYTADLEEACTDMDIIVFAVPSPYVRETAQNAKPHIPEGQVIVDVAKGIEVTNLLTLTEVIDDVLQDETINYVALSGPTHAEEVSQDLPTVIVSACADLDVAEYVQRSFTSPFMRVYTNTDIRGVEICGALKNVIALATGMSEGLGYGDNAKAALITRGISEITRLGEKLGCNPETFSGLAGLGDLVVTCTSQHSRNNRAGFLMGKGKTAEEATEEVGMVVEGINAIPAAIRMGETYEIEMPITEAVNQIVNHGLNPLEAVNDLLNRESKMEM